MASGLAPAWLEVERPAFRVGWASSPASMERVQSLPGLTAISCLALLVARQSVDLRSGGHRGGELADPAHALGGRVGVVAELLSHPADAAMDAEPPRGGRDCFCCHFGGRGASYRCSPEANSATRRAPVTVLAVSGALWVGSLRPGQGARRAPSRALGCGAWGGGPRPVTTARTPRPWIPRSAAWRVRPPRPGSAGQHSVLGLAVQFGEPGLPQSLRSTGMQHRDLLGCGTELAAEDAARTERPGSGDRRGSGAAGI